MCAGPVSVWDTQNKEGGCRSWSRWANVHLDGQLADWLLTWEPLSQAANQAAAASGGCGVRVHQEPPESKAPPSVSSAVDGMTETSYLGGIILDGLRI